MSTQKTFLLAFIFLLVFCFSASAEDVGGCRDLGTPNTIYYLTQNVSSDVTCFTVLANNVTLDCNGYNIEYAKTATGYGIDNNGGYDYITIRDCKITQKTTYSDSHAIYFNGVNQGNVINNTITTNGQQSYGINLDLCSYYNNIINNTITTNGQQSYGISIHADSSHNRLSQNIISNNGQHSYGISFYSVSNNSAYSNTIKTYNTNGFGIYLASKSKDNTIANSTIVSKLSYAIYFLNVGADIPSNNLVYNNLLNGSSTPVGFYSSTAMNAINYWNTSKQAGTRIYSSGNYIGGNYYTNSSGTGFSDTCADVDKDGFCDSWYNVSANAATASVGANIDYLAYSDEYSSVTFSVVLVSPPNLTITNDNTSSVVFSVSGSELSYSCGVFFNGSLVGSNVSVQDSVPTTITTSELAEGYYLWFVNCSAGGLSNLSEVRVLWVDVSAPEATIKAPSQNAVLSHWVTWVWLNVSTNEEAVCVWDINENFSDGTFFDVTDSILHLHNFSVSEGSSYSLYYRCSDAANNTNVAVQHNFSVASNNAPVTTLNSPEGGYVAEVNYVILNWTCFDADEDNMTALIYGGKTGLGVVLNEVNCSNNLSCVFNWTGLTDGTYYWKVICSDGKLENVSEIRNFTVDSESPYDIQNCSTLNKTNSVYYLKNNVYSSGTCFIISANNVTLDCQGYNIEYAQTTMGYGIDDSGGYDYTTIKNCIIKQKSNQGNSHAIYFNGVNQGNVINNTITTNGQQSHGINLVTYSEYNTISGNAILTNNQFSHGIWLLGSSNNNLENNFVSTNGDNGIGIILQESSKNIVSFNSVKTYGVNGYGIYIIDDSDNNTIANSTITSELNYAIYLSSSLGLEPENNLVYNNLLNGSSTPIGFSTGFNTKNHWNTTKQPGTRIYSTGNLIGGNYYTNSSGTGFSDTCFDDDNDGFCSEYVLAEGNIDYLPLSDNESYCGNNEVEGGEACDGTNLLGKTCSSFSGYFGSLLRCSSDCLSFDLSGCSYYSNGGSSSGGDGGSGGGIVSTPRESCFDGLRNQGEEDVDCGGPCQPCISCSDGIQNQGETGVDCGGPCQPCKTTTTIATTSTTLAGSEPGDERTSSSQGDSGNKVTTLSKPINETSSTTLQGFGSTSTTKPQEAEAGKDLIEEFRRQFFGFLSAVYEIASDRPIESASIILLLLVGYLYYRHRRPLSDGGDIDAVIKEIHRKRSKRNN